MFIHVSILVAALTAVATAVPSIVVARGSHGTCDVGELLCCQNLLNSDSAAAVQLAQQQGITLPNNQVIGIECNTITANEPACVGEVTCCSNNLNGEIFADCIPPNVGI